MRSATAAASASSSSSETEADAIAQSDRDGINIDTAAQPRAPPPPPPPQQQQQQQASEEPQRAAHDEDALAPHISPAELTNRREPEPVARGGAQVRSPRRRVRAVDEAHGAGVVEHDTSRRRMADRALLRPQTTPASVSSQAEPDIDAIDDDEAYGVHRHGVPSAGDGGRDPPRRHRRSHQEPQELQPQEHPAVHVQLQPPDRRHRHHDHHRRHAAGYSGGARHRIAEAERWVREQSEGDDGNDDDDEWTDDEQVAHAAAEAGAPRDSDLERWYADARAAHRAMPLVGADGGGLRWSGAHGAHGTHSAHPHQHVGGGRAGSREWLRAGGARGRSPLIAPAPPPQRVQRGLAPAFALPPAMAVRRGASLWQELAPRAAGVAAGAVEPPSLQRAQPAVMSGSRHARMRSTYSWGAAQRAAWRRTLAQTQQIRGRSVVGSAPGVVAIPVFPRGPPLFPHQSVQVPGRGAEQKHDRAQQQPSAPFAGTSNGHWDSTFDDELPARRTDRIEPPPVPWRQLASRRHRVSQRDDDGADVDGADGGGGGGGGDGDNDNANGWARTPAGGGVLGSGAAVHGSAAALADADAAAGELGTVVVLPSSSSSAAARIPPRMQSLVSSVSSVVSASTNDGAVAAAGSRRALAASNGSEARESDVYGHEARLSDVRGSFDSADGGGGRGIGRSEGSMAYTTTTGDTDGESRRRRESDGATASLAAAANSAAADAAGVGADGGVSDADGATGGPLDVLFRRPPSVAGELAPPLVRDVLVDSVGSAPLSAPEGLRFMSGHEALLTPSPSMASLSDLVVGGAVARPLALAFDPPPNVRRAAIAPLAPPAPPGLGGASSAHAASLAAAAAAAAAAVYANAPAPDYGEPAAQRPPRDAWHERRAPSSVPKQATATAAAAAAVGAAAAAMQGSLTAPVSATGSVQPPWMQGVAAGLYPGAGAAGMAGRDVYGMYPGAGGVAGDVFAQAEHRRQVGAVRKMLPGARVWIQDGVLHAELALPKDLTRVSTQPMRREETVERVLVALVLVLHAAFGSAMGYLAAAHGGELAWQMIITCSLFTLAVLGVGLLLLLRMPSIAKFIRVGRRWRRCTGRCWWLCSRNTAMMWMMSAVILFGSVFMLTSFAWACQFDSGTYTGLECLLIVWPDFVHYTAVAGLFGVFIGAATTFYKVE